MIAAIAPVLRRYSSRFVRRDRAIQLPIPRSRATPNGMAARRINSSIGRISRSVALAAVQRARRGWPS